ncbi:FecR family protein [Parapedobacter tibetensis]|nr:FecR domain-containing protein [Parapedobacter tibetensis]
MEASLIQKFLRNECTAEEADRVANYLMEHPEALKSILPETEWESFAREKSLHPEQEKPAILARIRQQTGIESRPAVRLWRIAAVAASVLMLASIGLWVYYVSTGNSGKQHNEQQIVEKMPITRENLSDKMIEIHTEDGSVITLYPASELAYMEGESDHRDFYLKGAARFAVAKDKNRPFTVYAGGLATTALGTEFLVSAYTDDDETAVELISGKVVVSPDETTLRHGMKEVYLTPGDKVSLDRKTWVATVLPKSKQGDQPKAQQPPSQAVEKLGTTLFTDSSVVFTNQPLEMLFADLEIYFKTSIQCSPQVVKDMYFTGSLKLDRSSEQQTLEEIMHTVTTLNGLKIEKTDVGYLIK